MFILVLIAAVITPTSQAEFAINDVLHYMQDQVAGCESEILAVDTNEHALMAMAWQTNSIGYIYQNSSTDCRVGYSPNSYLVVLNEQLTEVKRITMQSATQKATIKFFRDYVTTSTSARAKYYAGSAIVEKLYSTIKITMYEDIQAQSLLKQVELNTKVVGFPDSGSQMIAMVRDSTHYVYFTPGSSLKVFGVTRINANTGEVRFINQTATFEGTRGASAIAHSNYNLFIGGSMSQSGYIRPIIVMLKPDDLGDAWSRVLECSCYMQVDLLERRIEDSDPHIYGLMIPRNSLFSPMASGVINIIKLPNCGEVVYNAEVTVSTGSFYYRPMFMSWYYNKLVVSMLRYTSTSDYNTGYMRSPSYATTYQIGEIFSKDTCGLAYSPVSVTVFNQKMECNMDGVTCYEAFTVPASIASYKALGVVRQERSGLTSSIVGYPFISQTRVQTTTDSNSVSSSSAWAAGPASLMSNPEDFCSKKVTLASTKQVLNTTTTFLFVKKDSDTYYSLDLSKIVTWGSSDGPYCPSVYDYDKYSAVKVRFQGKEAYSTLSKFSYTGPFIRGTSSMTINMGYEDGGVADVIVKAKDSEDEFDEHAFKIIASDQVYDESSRKLKYAQSSSFISISRVWQTWITSTDEQGSISNNRYEKNEVGAIYELYTPQEGYSTNNSSYSSSGSDFGFLQISGYYLRIRLYQGVEFTDLKLLRKYSDGTHHEVSLYLKIVSPETELGCSSNIIGTSSTTKLFTFSKGDSGLISRDRYMDIFTSCGELSKFELSLEESSLGSAKIAVVASDDGGLPNLNYDTAAIHDSGELSIRFKATMIPTDDMIEVSLTYTATLTGTFQFLVCDATEVLVPYSDLGRVRLNFIEGVPMTTVDLRQQTSLVKFTSSTTPDLCMTYALFEDDGITPFVSESVKLTDDGLSSLALQVPEAMMVRIANRNFNFKIGFKSLASPTYIFQAVQVNIFHDCSDAVIELQEAPSSFYKDKVYSFKAADLPRGSDGKTDFKLKMYESTWFASQDQRCGVLKVQLIEQGDDLLTTYERIVYIDQDPGIFTEIKTLQGGAFQITMVAKTIEINTKLAQARETFQINVCGAERLAPTSPEPLYLLYSPKSGVDAEVVSAEQIDSVVAYTPFNGLSVSHCPVDTIEVFNSASLTEPWGSQNQTEAALVQVRPSEAYPTSGYGFYQGQIQKNPKELVVSYSSPFKKLSVFASFTTFGGATMTKEIIFSICGFDQPRLIVEEPATFIIDRIPLEKGEDEPTEDDSRHPKHEKYRYDLDIPYATFKNYFTEPEDKTCALKFFLVQNRKGKLLEDTNLIEFFYNNELEEPPLDDPSLKIAVYIGNVTLSSPLIASFFIKASSSLISSLAAYKKVTLDFRPYIRYLTSLEPIEAINFLPKFVLPIKQFETRFFEDPKKQSESTFEFRTPDITDLEGDEIEVTLKGTEKLDEFASVAVEGGAASKFISLSLDRTKISPQLARGYIFQIVLSNPGFTDTAEYSQILTISYEYLNGTVCVNFFDNFFIHTDSFSQEKDEEAEEQSLEDFLKDVEEKEQLPVRLKIKSVGRDGLCTINFNQPLLVPEEVKRLTFFNTQEPRLLNATPEFDLRKVLQVTVEVKSDEDQASLMLFEISKWTDLMIEGQIRFDYPLTVSKGDYRDDVRIEVLQPSYFASKENPEIVLDGQVSLFQDIPRQLPAGVNEADIKGDAQASSRSVNVLLFIQVGLQVFMKGAMDKIWALLLWLQLVQNLTIYKVSMPANLEMFMEELRFMINFEGIKIDNILGFLSPGLSVQALLEAGSEATLQSTMQQSGVASPSILVNFLAQYGIVFLLGGLALFPLLSLALVPRLRSFVKNKLIEVWTKMVWGGIIRSLTFSYLNLALYLLAFATSQEPSLLDTLTVLLYNYVLVLYPLFILYFLAVNDQQLGNEYATAKFKPIMAQLSLRRSPYAAFFYPVFILRRYLFVVIPLTLNRWPAIQMQALVGLQITYVIVYGIVMGMPHEVRQTRKLEAMNEAVLMCLFYHMMCFTNFVIDSESSYLMSNTFLALLGVTTALNFIAMFSGNVGLLFLLLKVRVSRWSSDQDIRNKSSLIELRASSSSNQIDRRQRRKAFQLLVLSQKNRPKSQSRVEDRPVLGSKQDSKSKRQDQDSTIGPVRRNKKRWNSDLMEVLDQDPDPSQRTKRGVNLEIQVSRGGAPPSHPGEKHSAKPAEKPAQKQALSKKTSGKQENKPQPQENSKKPQQSHAAFFAYVRPPLKSSHSSQSRNQKEKKTTPPEPVAKLDPIAEVDETLMLP